MFGSVKQFLGGSYSQVSAKAQNSSTSSLQLAFVREYHYKYNREESRRKQSMRTMLVSSHLCFIVFNFGLSAVVVV